MENWTRTTRVVEVRTANFYRYHLKFLFLILSVESVDLLVLHVCPSAASGKMLTYSYTYIHTYSYSGKNYKSIGLVKRYCIKIKDFQGKVLEAHT